MSIKWIPTERGTYDAIRLAHPELVVHATATRLENSSLGDRLILTDWGFRDAAEPLVRFVDRGEGDGREVRYFIACVTNGESQ